MPDTISFARGAPSLDIVDVDGLKAAAVRAFENDPGGTTAYGTAVGYVPLRKWIAEKHGVDVDQVIVTNGSMQADAFLFELLVQDGDPVIVGEADVRPHPLEPPRPRRRHSHGRAGARRHLHRRARGAAARGRAPDAGAHHPQLPEPRRLHAVAGQARTQLRRSSRPSSAS